MMPVKLIEYTGSDGIRLDVKCDGTTVWLTIEQMAQLLGRDNSVIGKHVKNVFSEGELDISSNRQILPICGKVHPVSFYSLDVVISVGYRVKSVEGTRFRQWATKKLRDIFLSRVMDAQRIDRLEDRVGNVEQGLSILANEFNEWTILPAHKPMGFGAGKKGE